MKKFKILSLAAVLSVVTLLGSFTSAFAASISSGGNLGGGPGSRSGFSVYVYEDELPVLMVGIEPLVDGDDLLIPMQFLGTSLGYSDCSWDRDAGIMKLSNGSRDITASIEEGIVRYDDKTIELDDTARVVDDYYYDDYYILLGDAGEIFSYDTTWDNSDKTVTFTATDETPKSIIPEYVAPAPPKPTQKPETTPELKPTPEPETKPEPNPEKPANPRDNSVVVVSDGKELEILVKGTPVVFSDAKPFVDSENRTQVPIRAIAEILNCNVEWNQEQQLATITDSDGKVIQLTIGDRQLIVDNKIVEMDTAAIVIDGRTYIPIRFISEALGLNVFWEWDI